MSREDRQVLIVDDDEHVCGILSVLLAKEGIKAAVAHDGDTALKMIRVQKPDVVLLDFMMPGLNGMEVLKQAKGLDQSLPVIMMTGYPDIQRAVEAIKAGAHGYLPKPFENHDVVQVVRQALAEQRLPRPGPHNTLDEVNGALHEMMGPSDAVSLIISKVNRVAKSDFSVVIIGETGVGKELVAHAIHNASPRSEAPFVPVDCGAIPETLLESELFGHEKGSFTGADAQQPGKFETAQDGTLFLDEISNMPSSSQSKLLRALQDKMFYRVGGTKPLKVKARLVVATNRDLASGTFRRDLFFRLSEFTITVPPIRERKLDIPYLVDRFLCLTNAELKKNVTGLSSSAVKVLLDFDWPGNVRQLRSTIRRAVLLAEGTITEEHLDIVGRLPDLPFLDEGGPGVSTQDSPAGRGTDPLPLKEIVSRSISAIEREVLQETLRRTGGNKAEAARLLKIDYKTIHLKVKKYGIERDTGRNTA